MWLHNQVSERAMNSWVDSERKSLIAVTFEGVVRGFEPLMLNNEKVVNMSSVGGTAVLCPWVPPSVVASEPSRDSDGDDLSDWQELQWSSDCLPVVEVQLQVLSVQVLALCFGRLSACCPLQPLAVSRVPAALSLKILRSLFCSRYLFF